jgi:hypothetical protein
MSLRGSPEKPAINLSGFPDRQLQKTSLGSEVQPEPYVPDIVIRETRIQCITKGSEEIIGVTLRKVMRGIKSQGARTANRLPVGHRSA